MLPLTIIIIGLISALTPREWIERHIIKEIDKNDLSF
jgi:hypothetical protein